MKKKLTIAKHEILRNAILEACAMCGDFPVAAMITALCDVLVATARTITEDDEQAVELISFSVNTFMEGELCKK